MADIFCGGEEGPPPTPLSSPSLLLEDTAYTAAELATSSLFTGAEEVFAFQRCVSRLAEMQSVAWLGGPESVLATFLRQDRVSDLAGSPAA